VRSAVEAVLADAGTFGSAPEELSEVQAFHKQEADRLRSLAAQLQGQLDKVASAAKSAKDRSTRKEYTELELLRTQVVAAMRDFMNAEDKTGEQLFEHVAGTDSGEVTSEKFISFAKTLQGLEIQDASGQKLFSHIAEKQSAIGKDKFVEMMRLFYRVVKPTVLTETMSIKSKTLRRLENGEIVEGLEGPKKEDNVSVMRVRCRVVQDGSTGWVTVAGNQGTVFLELGGSSMTCVKETIITDGLSVTDSKTIRKIAKGEVIDVVEFERKDPSCDLMRIKGKAKVDGTVGWITVQGNSGATFLEPS